MGLFKTRGLFQDMGTVFSSCCFFEGYRFSAPIKDQPSFGGVLLGKECKLTSELAGQASGMSGIAWLCAFE